MTPATGPEHIYVHTRGIRLHVAVSGPRTAPLVLLIHGFGGGWFDWTELLPRFGDTDSYRVAAVDLRGYGRSDKTPRGYDLTTAASDMCGVVRVLGHPDALVVGHGEGGLIGWTMAAHEPERVRALVTLASAHPRVVARSVLLHPVSQWPRIRSSLFAQLPRIPERLLLRNNAEKVAHAFRMSVAPGFRDTDVCARHAELRREAMQVDKVAHLSCEYRRWTVRSRFRPEGGHFDHTLPNHTDAPVVCVDGSMDRTYNAKIARMSAAHGGRGSRTEVLFGVGHFPHIEDPAAVARIIRDAG
ncbi:alpha/beta fold hydrolase [Corynebacterium neomassiliense]|uniref:alpha/beta fold hydrolase n=1 Tax=Corynebacterium neomassiliense TaxID=2079482 RepID=UPI001030CE6B|nr:alpha/beta hydrolase [Corynebacterium neomassiliense]